MKKELYIVDGHALIYRAYYAFIKHPLTNAKGENTSAVFGFTRMLLNLIKSKKPSHLLVALDSHGKTFRHTMYEKYKAQRKPMPEDMIPQIPIIKKILQALNIKQIEMANYEADDIIGTIAKKAASDNFEIYIMSKDKDLSQLIDDHINMLLPSVKPGEDFKLVTKENSAEQFIVPPSQVIDLLAIMGDASDNIPGVKGIGPKGAAKLLATYKTLENIYENIDKIKPDGLKKKLIESKEQAFLSKDLATIHLDLNLDFDWDNFTLGNPNKSDLTEIFHEQNMTSLFKELDWYETVNKNNYQIIKSKQELDNFIQTKLAKPSTFAFDSETDGLDIINSSIIGLSFAFKENEAFYVAFKRDTMFDQSSLTWEEGVEMLRPYLESEEYKKIGQNIKFDYILLKSNGVHLKGIIFDTMLASFLLEPTARHNMDDMAERYLGYKTIKFKDITGKGKNKIKLIDIPLDKLGEYAAEDADVTLKLYHYLKPKIEENHFSELMQTIDMKLLFVLAKMEMNGVKVDVPYLENLSSIFGKKLKILEQKIYKEAGEEFNINSTKQLGNILFNKLKIKPERKTKTAFSTDVKVLEKLAQKHEIAKYLLDYRTINKLKNTYTDALPKLINPTTKRIHTSYNQTIAQTGRLTSTEPNLQNIPNKENIGRQIRNAFIPEKDYEILSSDYSQIELRILAHVSEDPALIEAFRNNKDVHALTAMNIYNINEQDVTKEKRAVAKTINFGVIYGMGPYKLSEQLKISVPTAQEYIKQYFKKYKGIQKYFDFIRNQITEHNYVENLFGRRRYFPIIKDLPKRQMQAVFRMAINTPIQGAAADLIKIAMINIQKEIENKQLKSKMIIQIHDELVFEVHKSEKEIMYELVKTKMENVKKFKIPLVVDINFGKNWAEAH